MKRTLNFFFLLLLVGPVIVKSQDQPNKTFIIIQTTNIKGSKITFLEHKRGISLGAYITFDEPNYTVVVTHMPSWVDYPSEGNREQIEISTNDLINSKVMFADKLTFSEWNQLEQVSLNQKIYMIFQEEYLSKDRFVLNHKFKAFEVRVTADGPI